jgi:hypothetical protein
MRLWRWTTTWVAPTTSTTIRQGRQSYQKFLDGADRARVTELYPMAACGKEQTANAALQADHRSQALPDQQRGAKVVNQDHPDFSPVLSVDGNALFFTSRRVRPDSSNSGVIDPVAGLPYENIYVSYKDREGNWQAPELLNINPPEGGHLAT